MSFVLDYCSGNDVTAALLFLVVFFLIFRAINRPTGVPPGPPILIPCLGNLPAFVWKDPLQAFQEWRQKYGDIYSIYFGNQMIVIISSYKMIKDAFVQQGETFSDRPFEAFVQTYVKDDNGLVMNSGESWKRERKFLSGGLKRLNFGRPAFESNIHRELEAVMLQFEQFEGPFNMKENLTFSIANIIMVIISGKRLPHGDPRLTNYIEQCEIGVDLYTRISVIMNCFPFLQHFPGNLFGLKDIVASKQYTDKYMADLHQDYTGLTEDTSPRCLLDICAEVPSRRQKDNIVLFTELMVAGVETTTHTVMWAVLYLLNYPNVQTKCREEIYKILGKHQLPTMSYKPSLPYVSATILETLRCSAVAPLGMPHQPNRDAVVNGILIPKEATVFANLNSVMYDPELFEDPNTFNPERFLNKAGEIEIPEYFIPFGTGRRMCLGEAAAKMELFLFLTALLQRFEFLPEGNEPPSMKGNMRVTYAPVPYKVRCVKCI